MRPSVTLFILHSAAIAVNASLHNGAVTARNCCYSNGQWVPGVTTEICSRKKATWDDTYHVCLITSIFQAADVLDCCLKDTKEKWLNLC